MRTPPLNGPLPLDANGFDEGPEVLPMLPKEAKGSLPEGCVCTRPWVEEKLLEPSRNGVAVPACHHDADVDWSSAVLMASAEQTRILVNFGSI